MKAAELRDYFRDECIAEVEESEVALDAAAERGIVVDVASWS